MPLTLDDLEKTILESCNWPNIEYYGTTVYNVILNNKSIIDIVCIRNEKGIIIDWITEDEEKISLNYITEKKQIDPDHTDPNLINFSNLSVFLNSISNTIKNTKPSFFISKRNTNKPHKSLK